MRLIDADSFRSGWNSDSVIGTTMQMVIDELPTIDPETLPIVRQLREELARGHGREGCGGSRFVQAGSSVEVGRTKGGNEE